MFTCKIIRLPSDVLHHCTVGHGPDVQCLRGKGYHGPQHQSTTERSSPCESSSSPALHSSLCSQLPLLPKVETW